MATRTSVGSGSWSAAGTWDTGVPVDGDSVVIAAGHSVLMDADTSGFANGIAGVTIQGSASTPGMLYFANGTNGHLKIHSTYTIAGTSGTNRGRLLANSNGTWGTTTPLQNTNTAVIHFTGTGQISMQYIDLAMFATQPTIPYVNVYGTAYTCTTQSTDVNPATDLITFNDATPPAAGTKVRVVSSGTLPEPLTKYDHYYVRSVTDLGSTFTCKLAYQNSDTQVVNLTSTGSGTLKMCTGKASGSAVCDVNEDVTGDPVWSTTANRNQAIIVSAQASTIDRQVVTLSSISSTQITISAATDSNQVPQCRIYIAARNVEIRTSTTSSATQIVRMEFSSHGSFEFSGLLNSTYGTYAAGSAVAGNYSTNYVTTKCVMSGVIYNFSIAFYYVGGGTMSGYIFATQGLYICAYCTITGTIAGTTNATYGGIGHVFTGEFFGNDECIYAGECVCGGRAIGGYYYADSATGTIFLDSAESYSQYTGINAGSCQRIAGLFSGAFYDSFRSTYGVMQNVISRGADRSDMYTSVGIVTGENVSFQSPVQCGNYLTTSAYPAIPAEHGISFRGFGSSPGTADSNSVAAWNVGGFTKSAAWVVGTHGTPPFPPPGSWIHVSTCQKNVSHHAIAMRFSSLAGVPFKVLVAAKQVASGFDDRPTFILGDGRKAYRDASYALMSWQIADNTDWQLYELTYSPTVDMPLQLYVLAKGGTASGSGGDDTFYWIFRAMPDDTSRPRTRVKPY